MSGEVPYRDDLRKVEAAAVKAWPALETADIEGWLWRWSRGGSHRANSVSTLNFRGDDVEAAIARAEDLYKARGGKLQFQITQVSEPDGLDALLEARGYAVVSPVITMAKPVSGEQIDLDGIGWGPDPDKRWLSIYMGVIDDARRRVVTQILSAVPEPRAFIIYRQNRITFSTCLGVVEDGMVAIECVATREETRRRGGARRVLAGAECWAQHMGAHTLYLQVAADNAGAIKLYESLGFDTVGRVHYRTKVLAGFMAPEDDGGARHLMPGRRLPSVSLASTAGKPVDPARLKGRSVLFAYPWTGRPGLPNPPDWDHIPGAHGSTPETEGFRDLHPVLQAMGIGVYGISTQSPGYQAEMAQRLRLPFPILSDEQLRLAEAWRLPVFRTGGEVYLKRLTLVLRDGRIERCFYPVHPPGLHAREVHEWLCANC